MKAERENFQAMNKFLDGGKVSFWDVRCLRSRRKFNVFLIILVKRVSEGSRKEHD